ncbi:MAG: hypothetical protein A2287_10140 [Candidatus Melainabacteria bacterium RIFOXYA12_FULL_32_12]|nr:MAG: hypothetical protein A2287_10140 [Candidatus Melainabacteria bacterium RIFOXYA12_FULL_32_12]
MNVLNNNHIINNPWLILKEGFNPLRERTIESILSFGNGYIGSRNSLEEYYTISEPTTYVAGIYENIPATNRNELARIPDWTRIQVFLDDNIIDLYDTKILEHKRYLDLKRGLVLREWKSQDSLGRITSIKTIKFISLDNKNTAFKSITIKPENYSGRLKVISGIDGNIIDSKILIPETLELNKPMMLGMETKEGDNLVVITQKSEFIQDNLEYNQKYSNKMVYEEWEWHGEYGKEYIINSLITVFTSLDYKNPIGASIQDTVTDYNNVLISQAESWTNYWNNADITIDNDEQAQRWVNFALYHLISTGKFSGNNNSIAARNLSGVSYQGHVFWDTEMYLLPFYTFTEPEIAKALLMYRYNTLQGARENARREGHKGACYAWESTDSGIEMTPTEVILPYGQIIHIYSGSNEIHISPDIAYAVWQYYQVTEDEDFLVNYGSEIIFETTRFSTGFLKKEDDNLYHIYDVVGPDEYHERIDDNAYTNLMTQHNLEIALKLINLLQEKYKDKYENLRDKINLQDSEISRWKEIKDKIYTGYNPETKIYEQFKGFFDLEYIDVKSYEPRTKPMDVILGRERVRNSQIIKQTDVLMFLFLLANKFSKDVIEANYNFYEQRTAHGSSLSPSIHSIIAARLGKLDQAYKYFEQNAQIDLDDKMGNAAGGIHMASIGGTWMSVVMGFAGIHIYDNGLLFDPHIPENWNNVKFSVNWHGQKINVQVRKDEITFKIIGNQSVNLCIGEDNWKELAPNNTYIAYKDQKWYWKD